MSVPMDLVRNAGLPVADNSAAVNLAAEGGNVDLIDTLLLENL
jgi:hypothetical protein